MRCENTLALMGTLRANGDRHCAPRVDSAVHVGHALTTHAIQSSVDFFSAQDQLLDRDAGETGGAHIGSRELTTGVFYLPVVIDVEQIRKNWLAGPMTRLQR